MLSEADSWFLPALEGYTNTYVYQKKRIVTTQVIFQLGNKHKLFGMEK